MHVDMWVYCMFVVITIAWCFQVECFPDALICWGLQCCSAVPCPLQKSFVPRPALAVSQPLSDWTGSKGFLSLSVSILQVDYNDFYRLQLFLWSLPLPSFLHRLLACTHRPVQKISSSKTSAGHPETFIVVIILILYLHLLGQAY